ncbi:MAG: enoyl-CoA hydratase/isomerase family protein [Candidatus Lokiarchaeota archaeon]|nr:enoyl-CoA hydratase/isomerase family protein [Candidatus Lokiarchaeota archaeon]
MQDTEERSASDMVLYEEKGKIAYLTFNRPEKLNAMNIPCLKRILDLVQHVDSNSNIKVLVINSIGRMFSAGYDLSIFKMPISQEDISNFLEIAATISKSIRMIKKPVIAEIQGNAIGFGCITAFAADFRFVANTDPEGKQPYFYLPELGIGITPASGPTTLPLILLGGHHAKEMLLGDRRIAVSEMDKWGAVTQICEPEDLKKQVKKFARNLAEKDTTLLFSTKTALTIMEKRFLDDCYNLERDLAIHWAKNLVTKDTSELDGFLENMWKKYGK